MDACLGGELAGIVRKSRVFVVGTGGIGCELAKNLVLTGFQDMVMVRTRGRRPDDKSTMKLVFNRFLAVEFAL